MRSRLHRPLAVVLHLAAPEDDPAVGVPGLELEPHVDAIAAMTGMQDVFRLRAADIDACCRLTGEFTLRSGQVASEYFDKYLFEAQPALLDRRLELVLGLRGVDLTELTVVGHRGEKPADECAPALSMVISIQLVSSAMKEMGWLPARSSSWNRVGCRESWALMTTPWAR